MSEYIQKKRFIRENPLFYLPDVCRALDLKDVTSVLRKLSENEKYKIDENENPFLKEINMSKLQSCC